MADDTIDYEQLSYGKLGYKRVQRLRKKGERRGIEVPKLEFELHKPDKPRIVFWIAAIVGIIVFVGILVGTGFLIKFLVDVFSEFYKDTGGLFKTLTNPGVLFVSQGISIAPLLFLIMAYLFVALIGIIPLMIALYCYYFVRNMLYVAKCSKEEFAKGERISGYIVCYIGILVAATIILIVVLSLTDAQTAKFLVGLIYGGVVIIFGGLLALMIIERQKCKKWFEGLNEDNKQNFLEHDKALRLVKSHLNLERQLWNNSF